MLHEPLVATTKNPASAIACRVLVGVELLQTVVTMGHDDYRDSLQELTQAGRANLAAWPPPR